MMKRCKHCGSELLKKDGVRGNVQKWRCKSCNTSQGLKDNREKYSEKEKRMAVTLPLTIL